MTSIPSNRPDMQVDGYRLLDRIGEGGMGVVHLAEAPDGRRVALKVLRPHVVGDDEARERLAREVDSLRKVRSAHVAEVIDADPWGELPYVVTRYIPGHSLHELVRRDGALPGADLEHVARRLLEAIRDVHRAGVLHRDVKPTNVVMEGRAPILIDFGLARLAEDPRLTATGWLLGTPGYLAPEILYGDQATGATDVHGWAATLVYAATGRPPYGTGHTMAILDRTRRGQVYLGGVPERLRPLLAQCLAVEPLERPATGEVVAELDALAAAAKAGAHPEAQPQPGPHPRPEAGPDPTVPWQLVPPEEPTTEVIAPSAAGGGAQEPPTTRLPAAAPPPTRLAPTPNERAGPEETGVLGSRPSRSLGGWGHLRRASMLLGLGAVVATSFRLAPYVALAVLAVAVVALRGASRSQQASWQRRARRGPRWYDMALSVAGYPWHALRGAVGSAVLVAAVAVVAGVVTAALVVLGLPTPEAVHVGGALAAVTAWSGPGAGRVRHPVGRVVTAAARSAVVGWLVVALAVVVTVVLWLASLGEGVSWSPGSGPPWAELPDLLPELPAGLG